MGWAVGFDNAWNRDIGYGVPAICDSPGCGAEIDRGLSHVCGGCGLYFCGDHLFLVEGMTVDLCDRCCNGKDPYDPTPDTRAWINHKMTHPSWEAWRLENLGDRNLLD